MKTEIVRDVEKRPVVALRVGKSMVLRGSVVSAYYFSETGSVILSNTSWSDWVEMSKEEDTIREGDTIIITFGDK